MFTVLSNGVEMPTVGLGTYLARGPAVGQAVKWALQAKYRHIDTASIYRNEDTIAAAIQESGVPRGQIFITTKLSPHELGTDKASAAVGAALSRLRTDYIDCMLIHWPGAGGHSPSSPANRTARLETWRVLEAAYKSGRARAIGVSNFEARHLEELRQEAEVMPMVNQIEVHPRLPQRALRAVCHAMGMQVVAYSSLGCGELPSHPTVQQVATEVGRTAAQVLLRWGIQSGCAVIPKSVHQERIEEATWEQLSGWQLSEEHMKVLDALDDGCKYCWDPSSVA